MAEDYSKYPCGADGLSFPNGLPEPNTRVWVKTVWSNDEWQTVNFQKYNGGYYFSSKDSFYDWFSAYSKPDVENGSFPIVLEWKE
jgi:hypothetical protein